MNSDLKNKKLLFLVTGCIQIENSGVNYIFKYQQENPVSIDYSLLFFLKKQTRIYKLKKCEKNYLYFDEKIKNIY